MNTETARPSACSQAEFARLMGWTPPYVTALKKAGRLVLTGAGQVDVQASIDRIQQTTQSPERASAPAVTEPARTDKERQAYYAAETARLDLEERLGALLRADDVAAVVADAGAALRTALQSFPDRHAAALAHFAGDERRVRQYLQEQVDDLLHDLARRFDRAAQAGRA